MEGRDPAWDAPPTAEEKIYQWLENAGVRDSPEALITAAQEQTLITGSIEVGVYKTKTGSMMQTLQRCS